MKQTIITTILIFICQLTFGQVDLKKAELNAKKDFKKGNYFFITNMFCLLKHISVCTRGRLQNFWVVINEDSLSHYYPYYDSVQTVSLKNKYFISHGAIRHI